MDVKISQNAGTGVTAAPGLPVMLVVTAARSQVCTWEGSSHLGLKLQSHGGCEDAGLEGTIFVTFARVFMRGPVSFMFF